jgi:carbonic anhydrase
MKTSTWLALIAMAGAGQAAHAQQGSHPHHWDYAGEVGPEHWQAFGMGFTDCAGRNQSPVDLRDLVEAQLPPLDFDYGTGGFEIVNNGHAVQVNFAPGSTLSVDRRSFALKQVHFHSPSENRIEGASFPIEAHFVHADAAGNLAVVALMVEQGADNEVLAPAWAHMPARQGESHRLQPALPASALLPEDRDYYRYEGSLTTPPCSEGVRWLVLKQPVAASAGQIKALTDALGRPNNRPVQPIGARLILK